MAQGRPRSWHDINGNEVVPETNPAVGEWVSIPNHGVILSGAFPAHALFEFPHAEFEVLQGYDLNENGLCDHTEDRECLDVFSDVALAQGWGWKSDTPVERLRRI